MIEIKFNKNTFLLSSILFLFLLVQGLVFTNELYSQFILGQCSLVGGVIVNRVFK